MGLGAGPKLLKLLDEGTPGAKEQAAAAIDNLSFNADNKVKLMGLGAESKLRKLLDEGTPNAQKNAAGALKRLGT